MKTRVQLLWKICEVLQDVKCLHVGEQELNRITDLVVEACEEVVLDTIEGYTIDEVREMAQVNRVLQNLKKLKSK